jgi:uncharacterized damage-inducible protein DinB
MNIYGAKQLANSFRTVRKNTIQVAEDIPDSQYGFVAAEGTRSVAQTLTHLATLTPLWQDMHGAKRLTNMEDYDFLAAFDALTAEENKERSKSEIVDLLRTEGEKFAAFLEGLSDEVLAEEIVEPTGAKKSRLEALMSAKEHEMHHRGQLMLIERMLGIVPHLTKQYADMERAYREQKQEQMAKGAAPSA